MRQKRHAELCAARCDYLLCWQLHTTSMHCAPRGRLRRAQHVCKNSFVVVYVWDKGGCVPQTSFILAQRLHCAAVVNALSRHARTQCAQQASPVDPPELVGTTLALVQHNRPQQAPILPAELYPDATLHMLLLVLKLVTSAGPHTCQGCCLGSNSGDNTVV